MLVPQSCAGQMSRVGCVEQATKNFGSVMRQPLIVAAMAALSGCASVEVQYAAAPSFDQTEDADTAASRGLSYYALSRIHVSVDPAPKPKPAAAQSNSKTIPNETSNAAGIGVAAAKLTTPGSKAIAPAVAGPSPGNSKPKRGKSSGGKTTGPAVGQHTDASATAPKPSSSVSSAASGTDDKATSNTKPAEATIDGQPWIVTLSAVPDTTKGFLMGGTNGFWRKTTITASRPENSDRPNTVTVKAENLTATRLNQVATVIGYVLHPSTSADSKGGLPEQGKASKDEILKHFEFDVGADTINQEILTGPNSGWSYELAVDNPRPDGAISFEQFKALTLDGKKKTVNYFPVPACLPTHLILKQDNREAANIALVVADPGVVRLEPLPLDGKLTLSSICGSSVEGSTQVDRYDEVFSDLAALQKAYIHVAGTSSDIKEGSSSAAASASNANTNKPDE